MIMWTDASAKNALSFVYAGNGFIYPIDNDKAARINNDIFFLEQLSLVSALYHSSCLPHPPKRLLIFTDSLEPVSILNSLSAHDALHNAPLLVTAKIILLSGIDLRICHIAGKDNIAADLLSRFLFRDFHSRFPAYCVHTFTPPRELLPA
jgi:hypothetical protein